MSEWQPIDSAPKDGTWILLSGGEINDDWNAPADPPVVCGQWTNWLNGDTIPEGRWQFAWYDGGFYGEYQNPTHWMPAPKPPRS